MNVKPKLIILFVLMQLAFVSCSSGYTGIFQIDQTGDKIRVEVDTSDGWSVEEKSEIMQVSKDGEPVLQAIAYARDYYNITLNQLKLTGGMTILEESEKDGNSYTLYEYNAEMTSYVYIIKVKNTDSCVVIEGLKDKELTEEGFSRVKLSWSY